MIAGISSLKNVFKKVVLILKNEIYNVNLFRKFSLILYYIYQRYKRNTRGYCSLILLRERLSSP